MRRVVTGGTARQAAIVMGSVHAVGVAGVCLLPLLSSAEVLQQRGTRDETVKRLPAEQREHTDMKERPLLSRKDLPELIRLERQGVLSALGSFDSRGMSEEEFARRTLPLLDPAAIPGLSATQLTTNLPGVLHAMIAACAGGPAPIAPTGGPANHDMADDVVDHRFSFYGEKHALPENIDWDANPGTAHWSHDLNRFGYLRALEQAHRETGDRRYSHKMVALMLDWIEKCDFERAFRGSPYAFGSYLNQAIHAGQWARSARYLAAQNQIKPMELLRILKSLQEHLAYLEIVTNGHSGNWPTIGCMGMLSVLEMLPVFAERDRFATYCRKSLAEQIVEQVLPDGVQDELTPHYHQVVVNNLVNACRSLRAVGMDLEPRTLTTLREMVRYTQQTIVPDGSKHVAFNDSDPDSVPNLAQQMAALGCSDWLLPPSQLGPQAFPYAGVAFLRQRQDRGDLYLAFDAGPFGRSHQHEDRLGFWLFAYGRNLLVDPGRHLYDSTPVSYYAYLTSTRAHSTILVDGEGQHSAGRRDTWIAKAPLDLGWSETPGDVRAVGTYALGYGKDNAIQVTHRREIVLVKERCWVLFDVLTGFGEHRLESRFQFAPGKLVVSKDGAHTSFPDGNLLLRAVANRPIDDLHVEEGAENPRGGWYSDSYNRIEPAPALSLALHGALPVRMATLLFPYRGTSVPEITFEFDGQAARIRHVEIGNATVTCRLE